MYSTSNVDDIPVGGVNIDSAWSNCINNFDFNRTKFPNPEQLVKDFHSKGAKVILVIML